MKFLVNIFLSLCVLFLFGIYIPVILLVHVPVAFIRQKIRKYIYHVEDMDEW